MTCHQLLSLKNWLTPELKKNKVFAVCVNVLQRTSIKIPGKLTNYNSAEEIFMQQSILLKRNEISFSLKITTYL